MLDDYANIRNCISKIFCNTEKYSRYANQETVNSNPTLYMYPQKQGEASWIASEMQTVFRLVGQMIFKLSAMMCTGFPD